VPSFCSILSGMDQVQRGGGGGAFPRVESVCAFKTFSAFEAARRGANAGEIRRCGLKPEHDEEHDAESCEHGPSRLILY